MPYSLITLDGTLTLDDSAGTIAIGNESPLPAAEATASIETAGEINKRITASRIVLTGFFALAWQKKKDDRELYLTVQTTTTTMLARVDPKRGEHTRRFAAAVNDVGAGRLVADPALAKLSAAARPTSTAEITVAQKEKYERMTPEQKARTDRNNLIFGVVAFLLILAFIIWAFVR